jgi:hypothetical protein
MGGDRTCHCLVCPDKPTPVIIDDLRIGIEEFVFEVRKVRIVKLELPLQGTITHPASAAEDVAALLKHLFKGHNAPFSNRRDEPLGWLMPGYES